MNKVVKKMVDIFEAATGERKASLKVAVGIRGESKTGKLIKAEILRGEWEK